MLDKLMKLPVILEGASYLCVDGAGSLGSFAPQSLSEFLDEKILDILTPGSISISIELFERNKDIYPDDGERVDNRKIRVSVVQEICGVRKMIARAGVVGPSIDSIMAYVESL